MTHRRGGITSRTAVYAAAVAIPMLGSAGYVVATATKPAPTQLPSAEADAAAPYAALGARATADAAAFAGAYKGDSIADVLGLDLAGTRRASPGSGPAVYAIPTDRGYTCVAFAPPPSGVPVMSCRKNVDLSSAVAWVGTGQGADRQVAVLVPDGYTSVSLGDVTVHAHGNAAVLAGARTSGVLTVSGPGRATIRQAVPPARS